MRKVYRERRDAFIYEARKYLSGLIDFPGIDAGMDVMGYLQENTSDSELSRRLRATEIDVPLLSIYALRDCEPGLLFGFTAYTPAQIRLAMQTVSSLILKR
jgi:DNA-binding transcriptional MocR family regulator